MTAPRHLWSGDWRRESAAAAQELESRQAAPAEEAPATPRPWPSRPSTRAPSTREAATRTLSAHAAAARAAATRALAHLRRLRPHGAVVMALALLVSAGVGYAAVSSLVGSGGRTSSGSGKTPVAGSPARTAAPAWLGADTVDFPPAGGVMVVNVVPGSPAAAAGLEPGDVITKIGKRPVQTPAELESALAGMHAGQQVEIQYEQGPIPYTTRATLRARPANGP